MQKLISVIVPFFNAKTYLESNLSKWLQQSDAHFELVLVDDGSMDGSGELARAWAERHDHVSVHHKVNGGVSSARNLGLSVARGDLILFVDADDTVEPDFVASMREALVGQDLAVCAYDSVGAQLSVPFVLPQGAPVTLERVYEHSLCSLTINGGCCNKGFQMDLIRQHGLRFDESMSVGEDMVFLADYFQYCRSVAYVDRVLYHYTVNVQSLTQLAINQRRVTARDASVLLAMDALVQRLREQSPTVRGYGDFRRVRSSLRLLFQMVLSGSQEPKWLAHIALHCRAGWLAFWRSPHARWIERLTVLGVVVAPAVVFSLASALARRRPRWVAELRI